MFNCVHFFCLEFQEIDSSSVIPFLPSRWRASELFQLLACLYCAGASGWKICIWTRIGAFYAGMNRRSAARAARPQLRTLVPSFGALLIGMTRPARRAQRAHKHAGTRLASLNRTCQNLENSHSVPHPARAARQQLRYHRTSLLHRTRRNIEIQSLGTAPGKILKYSHSVPHPPEL